MKTAEQLVASAKNNIEEISIEEAVTACESADIIIDVREPDEYAVGHLKNAVSIPRGVLEFKIADMPQVTDTDTSIVLYCKTSGRAALAAQSLADLGYNKVKSITGGFDAWAEAGKPVVIPQDKTDFY